MGIMQKEDYLELGRMYAKEGQPEAALKSLHRALLKYIGVEGTSVQIKKEALEDLPSELLSYYGLCIALVENRVQEGMTFCRKAVSRDFLRSDFYLNLGRVYLKANQKTKALETFQRGLEMTEKNGDLMKELKKFGIRQKPALHFLPRGHFLNRYIGLLFQRANQKTTSGKKKR